MTTTPIRVHKYVCSAMDWFVNAYVVETPNAVVLVDGGIALSSSREIRGIVESTGKPIAGVLLTHGHPDHYVGVAEIIGSLDVPIVATQRATEQVRERDQVEAPVLASFFQTDFPTRRVFPNTVARHGDVQTFDGVEFKMTELGPCESEADSLWTAFGADGEHCFVGDLIYNRMHAFFMDGYADRWLRCIDDVLAASTHATRLYPGHGDNCGVEGLYWQRGYIQSFLALMKSLLDEGDTQLSEEKKATLLQRMDAYVGNQRLQYLLTFGMDQTIRLLRERKVI